VSLLLLIRHAVTDQTGKRLYGRTPGVRISELGRRQTEALARHLQGVKLTALYSSPLERCLETAEAVAAGRRISPTVVPGLNEVDYGDWAGRTFGSLARMRAWRTARSRPSTARFPGGETLVEAQARSVGALEELAARHPRGTVAVVTHGDVIRLSLAHFAGIHIDLYQRLEVSPASVTVLALGDGGPRVLRVNDTGSLTDLTG